MVIAYEVGGSSVAAVTAAAYLEFQSNGTRPAYVSEVDLFVQTAVAAGKTQIGRPGNTPTGGAATVGGALQPNGSVAATAGVTTTWATAPTAPSPAFRQMDAPATIGSAMIFTWPPDREVVVGLARNLSLIVWNASGSTGPILSYGIQFTE